MVHMIERSLRAHGHEIQSQLHHHPGAPERERSSIGRKSVPVTVLNDVQEHEEATCSGHEHSQRSDFPCRKIQL